MIKDAQGGAESRVHSKKLLEMCKARFNEPLLVGRELVRLVGYAETAIDCYLVVRHCGGKETWHTCVGGYVFLSALKGQGRAGEWDDCLRLQHELDRNGCPEADEFRIVLEHNNMEMTFPSVGPDGCPAS